MQNDSYTFRRGEVYFADLGDHVGSVQRGLRPVVIMQNDIGNREGPTLIVIPLTTQLKKLWLPVHVLIPKMLGLDDVSMALCEQVITIDKAQICSYVGVLGQVSFAKVMVATLISLGFMPVERRRQLTREGANDMILTLCQEHKQSYMNSKEYRVLRLDHFQNKETCTLCNRMGYDYKITHIPMRENRRNK